MALNTQNIYGNISISDDAVSVIASRVAKEVYGIVDLAPRRLSDSILIMLGKVPIAKGAKVTTMGNRVFVDLYVILKDGVNKDAVIESLKSAVEYNIEHQTGMRVKSVAVHVVGVRL
ncbi:MAG: Asp23/Gls24 family envelope stress response protein [Firmicutes bacterium]|nr:Asp23/Gls24 family envelope stress response protein [Bacillota bacterium]